MNIENIANAMAEADKHRGILTEEERSFIAYFAYQTGDMKQTKMLIDRLAGLEEGSARRDVVKLFEEQLYKQPKAIRQIEELLVSIDDIVSKNRRLSMNFPNFLLHMESALWMRN